MVTLNMQQAATQTGWTRQFLIFGNVRLCKNVNQWRQGVILLVSYTRYGRLKFK